MAIEYNLSVSPVMTDRAALDYLADMLGLDRRFTDVFAARDDLQVDISMDTAEEDQEMAALLGGVKKFLSITFRQAKNIGEERSYAGFRDMLHAAVKFFEDFPEAKGAFTYQYGDIYLQRFGDEGIVLDERLRRSEYSGGLLDGLLTEYPVREIDQVL